MGRCIQRGGLAWHFPFSLAWWRGEPVSVRLCKLTSLWLGVKPLSLVGPSPPRAHPLHLCQHGTADKAGDETGERGPWKEGGYGHNSEWVVKSVSFQPAS